MHRHLRLCCFLRCSFSALGAGVIPLRSVHGPMTLMYLSWLPLTIGQPRGSCGVLTGCLSFASTGMDPAGLVTRPDWIRSPEKVLFVLVNARFVVLRLLLRRSGRPPFPVDGPVVAYLCGNEPELDGSECMFGFNPHQDLPPMPQWS
jgi:hypothetical protein